MRNLTMLLLLAPLMLAAQKESLPKFGKVDPETFQKKAYAVDSSAPAVILLDLGKTDIIGNRKGWFSMRHTHRRRTHILKKDGYEHANTTVFLYKNADGEIALDNLKCYTYNQEGEQVVATKLEKAQIFEEQVDKNRRRIRFTAPAVKEGSVVEFEYTTISDFYFNLVPWEFQGSIPRVWSEYQFSLPQFMDFLLFGQGYFPYQVKEQKDRSAVFSVTETGPNARPQSFTCNVTDYRWAMKEVPILKEEGFTSTLDNHVAKIEFQLSGYKYPLNPRPIMSDWTSAAKALMDRDDFGKLVNAHNGWLDDVLKPLLNSAHTAEEKARRIFTYVRDNYTCTDNRAVYAEQSLRNVVKNQRGSVSELNMLLVALYRHAGFDAEPVLLSTRENGYASSIYPMIDKYNYVVANLNLNGSTTTLDASRKQIGFGRLPAYCYNGSARRLDAAVSVLNLEPDSLTERRNTFFNLASIAGKWTGSIVQTPGYYQSMAIREAIRDKGKTHFQKELAAELGSGIVVDEVQLDSLDNPDIPLRFIAEVQIPIDGEDLLYFNPVVEDRYTENPFKAATRYYPVEMPYTIDRVYVATIQVPQGYELDELPKSARMAMNEAGDARFDYLLSHSNGVVSMRMALQIKRTFFSPDEYDMLREFFNHVVSKQSEQIVFKKKK